MNCKACKKPGENQVKFDVLRYSDNFEINKPWYTKPSFTISELFFKNYKGFPLIILPKPTKNEYKLQHLIIGQERLMLYNIFKLIGIQQIDILITTACSCLNSRFKPECFEKTCRIIKQLDPKSVILLDNKEKVLEKKLKFFRSLIHPKKLLQHGGNWAPNFLQQVQFWKELLT